ncbi:MAG: Na+/H+ antiporter subunit D [Candidatus Cyclonatronum sp.]|uniref:Na+/H+ antiporter subunit D n=1 Tax=Cyclonatronum sp. TaxID=3024185 RepID=UPI0025C2EF0D|nr:Na+/H+ antiporter subunit D [Cyclonatronum sp.]MCC5933941.1 Na+/H+ antiporter subunit D [Balneolales bacterium]MCH8486406.1 Na+/H+ antiporter subunit D [Cyclonatronum sp.]
MSNIIIYPILIPILTASLALIAFKNRELQRWLSVIGSVATFIAGCVLLYVVYTEGIQVLQPGNWEAPFGISMVADLFSALMVCVTGLMAMTISIYSLGDMDKQRESFGFQPLFQILIFGVIGAFLTGDLFNLYVWFEVMLITSFVLLAIGNGKAQLDGAVKYVVINLLSSLIFLAGVGIMYGLTGTLNLAAMAQALQDTENTGLVITASMMFLVSFGIKSAVFPLFFWLPASYHTPPVTITAIFGALLTKVGVYSLVRVFTLLFTQDIGYTHTILLWISVPTMVVGVLGAASQYDVRKILSFHIVSQIGYMIMGLAFFTKIALAGVIYYILHNILAKTNLFLVAGIAQKLVGSFHLSRLGGLYKNYPLVSSLFAISAISLAGLPPLTGFWAKYTVIYAGLEVEQWVVIGFALAVGLMTMFSMTKIWMGAYWSPLPDTAPVVADKNFKPVAGAQLIALLLPTIIIAGFIVVLGIFGEPFYALLFEAADQLLDPSMYINAVLNP